MNYDIRVECIEFVGGNMRLTISGEVSGDEDLQDYVPNAKLVLYFNNGKENRRIPFVLNKQEKRDHSFLFRGEFNYLLDYIFWDTKNSTETIEMKYCLLFGAEYLEDIAVDYSNVEVNIENPQYTYSISDGVLQLQKTASPIKRKGIVRSLFRALFGICNFLIGVALLPWFLLDALMTFCGVTNIAKTVISSNPLRRVIGHINYRFSAITGYKITSTSISTGLITAIYSVLKKRKIKKNRITFISQRREVLSGNFDFVYNQLKEDTSLDISFILNTKTPEKMTLKERVIFCNACATSKVIILDEFTPQIHYITLKKDTTLIQLWHACGAFKTFGFTRLGKPKGSPQQTKMHRNYDYVTVSSSYCKKCHSEGFGISDEKVVPTGIPRTDVFFDEEYKAQRRDHFYTEYPLLKGKKIIMFAPTFRGMVKETAFYPVNKFDVGRVLDAIGDEYALIIKHHPFVKESHPIPDKYKNRVVDLSDNSELNDLMFVCDLIITDYSSLIFEASLLKIPMLFYVYDLEEYIADRDFYFDLKLLSPGKLVYNQQELISAIQRKDFEQQRIDEFEELFFDDLDGQATKRVVSLIQDAMG